MLGSLSLTLLLLGALADELPAGELAFVEVTALPHELARLQASPWGALVGRWLPRENLKALTAAEQGELVAACYRTEPSGLAGLLALTSGAASTLGPLWDQELSRRGYTVSEVAAVGQPAHYQGPLGSLWLRHAPNFLSLANRADLVAALPSGKRSLGHSSLRARVRARAESVPLWAGVDVQRFYGYLARLEAGSIYAGYVRRLGLAQVEEVRLSGALASARRLEVSATVVAPKPWDGLLDAFGTGLPSDTLTAPKGSLGYVRLSVRPQRLWGVVQRLLAQRGAMETTLFQSQLEALEAELHLKLNEALGAESRLATLMLWPAGSAAAWAASVEVADAGAVARLAEAVAQGLPGIVPALRATVSGAKGLRLLTLARDRQVLWVLSLPTTAGAGRLVVGDSEASVRALVASPSPPLTTNPDGRVFEATWVGSLGWPWLAKLAKGSAIGREIEAWLPPAELQKAAAATTMVLTPNTQGLELGLVVEAR